MIYLKGGESEKARGFFSEALRQNTTDTKALTGMGALYFEAKQFEKAAVELEKAARLEENCFDTLFLLARTDLVQNKFSAAAQRIESAIKIDSTSPEGFRVAGEIYENDQKKPEAVRAYLEAARIFREELDLENCLQCLEKVRKLDPEDARPHLIEGDFRVTLGDYSGAKAIYEQAQMVAPDNDEVYQKLAVVYQETGETQKAVAGFQKSLTLNPNNIEAHLGLGDLKTKQKNYNEAIQHFSTVKNLDPKNQTARIRLAETYRVAGKSDLAVAELRQVLDVGANGPPANMLMVHKLMGDIHKARGNYREAKLHLTKAIEINPDDISAYEALSGVESAMGQKQDLQNTLAMIKLLDPGRAAFVPKTPTPAAKKEVKTDLNPDLLEFIRAFPFQPPRNIAVISIDQDLSRASLWSRFRAHFGFSREDWSNLRKDLERALSTQYTPLPKSNLDHTLSHPPYNQIKLQDIDDDELMVNLCQILGVDGIFYYHTEKVNRPKGNSDLSLHGYLFDNSKRRWTASVTFSYPAELLRATNWFFCLLFSLFFAGAVAYGSIYWQQGFGNLQVDIERDAKTTAFFSVKISKNPNIDLTQMKSALRKDLEGKKYTRKVKFGSKTEKSMVEKDCRFEKVHAGHYFVCLYGVILDTTGKQVGNYQLTKEVDIEKDATANLAFDLMPKTAYVSIQVFDGEQPANGAEVSIKELAGTKYIKDDQGIFFELEPGEYVLLVDHNQKKFSKKIRIPSVDHYHFSVNLQGRSI